MSRRCSLLLLLPALGCGHASDSGGGASARGGEPAASGAASSKFTHDAPRFAIDLPAGVAATPTVDPGDGTKYGETTLTFTMPRGEILWISYAVSFSPPAKVVADQKAAYSTPTSSNRIISTGDLPGGGAWVEQAGALYHTVTSWLPVEGGAVVSCWITSTEDKVGACKSLRAKP
jgi:hypothetical protein